MKDQPKDSKAGWKRWLGAVLIVISLAPFVYLLIKHSQIAPFLKQASQKDLAKVIGMLTVPLILLVVGIGLLVRSRKSPPKSAEPVEPAQPPPPPVTAVRAKPARKVNYSSCSVLQSGGGQPKLWQFESRKGVFALSQEHAAHAGVSLPAGVVNKTWSSIWQPKLNVAWLPPESVFLRVVQLPQGSPDETLSMVELQLEKISPIPVTQLVWSVQPLPPLADGLQSLIVILAERKAVEEFLGQLEGQGFLADRLELPALDQLLATPVKEDGVWIYPGAWGGPNTAIVAWCSGGTLQNINFISLPASGDRAASLKEQLSQTAWAGELEGWLTSRPAWHLVAEAATAGQWETPLRQGLDEPIAVTEPVAPAKLAALTANRATHPETTTNLLPPEFSKRYRQQFFDRLWMRGLFAVGVVYIAGVLVYFAALAVLSYQTQGVEQQVKDTSGNYTNTIQLKARYGVLKERQELKFAALDCWKSVAEFLPDTLTLEGFNFNDGQRLTLNGNAPKDDAEKVFSFYSDLRKAAPNGQPLFSITGGDTFNSRLVGAVVVWSFTLELKRVVAQ